MSVPDAKHSPIDRTATILPWAGRALAGAWGAIFLLSITAEAASGFLPGGSTLTSVLNYTFAGLTLAGVALSSWQPWLGGVMLVVLWLASCLSLTLGLEPQTDVSWGIIVGAITALLPGLLLIAASILRHQKANT